MNEHELKALEKKMNRNLLWFRIGMAFAVLDIAIQFINFLTE